MEKSKSSVVVTRAEPMNYREDYVALPKNYGSPEYYARKDIISIIHTINENLTDLNNRIGFLDKMRGKKVIIKPNLVSVWHDMGFVDRDYPESTDPRVLDAVIIFLKKHTDNIVIVESSGRGMPTRASFKISGIDRLAKYHAIECIALEEQSAKRYILPKAKVMKEIIIPEIFSEVVDGDAYYISMPKMKTNIYTGVTLGFKNSMGIITYNLRQRNHNYAINQKLVDMLHLFKADLVIIDGIIGGEGNCPAPVDPVDSYVIVSGNNSVETDMVATRIMGHDPDEIELMRISKMDGFGDPEVEVTGDLKTVQFKPADPSLVNDSFHKIFPNIKLLVGHMKSKSPEIKNLDKVTNEVVQQMELSCRGGCLASTRFSFDMLMYEGVRRDIELIIIIGKGTVVDGGLLYFDRDGKAYTIDEIKALKGKKLAMGNCTSDLKGIVNKHIDGCMPFPNAAHVAIHKLTRTRCALLSLKNKYLFSTFISTLKMRSIRKKKLRKGKWLDCIISVTDGIFETRELSESEKNMDYIEWGFPVMTAEERKQFIKMENREIIDLIL